MKLNFKKQIVLALAGGLIAGVAIGWFNVLTEWLQVAHHGTNIGMAVAVLLSFCIFAAFLAIPVFAILLIMRQTRRWAATLLAAALSLIVGFLSLAKKPADTRTKAFHNLAQRTVPLVLAITAYESDHKKLPASLADLVPDYLPSVPTTQMSVYPEFKYESGSHVGDKWHGNPWVLYVETSRGYCNWDMFIYFPKQNYPEYGYGGKIEKIGAWAYVHE